MQCIYNGSAVFEWGTNNLRKIRAHRIKAEEVEKALSNDPIPVYERDLDTGQQKDYLARRLQGE